MNTQMVVMGYKNISIREDIYIRLRKAKRDAESFSDVVARLLKPDDDILDLFGTLSMTEEERSQLFADLEEMWGAWKH
ncbi:MAG: antitoxin VapB family protein [Candidatus Thorarchaeota archaeon]